MRREEIQNQYDLKKLLKIRTFDEIQRDLSSRFRKPGETVNPLLTQHGSSKLHPK